MQKKKIETLGQFLQHLVDDEEGKNLRKGEGDEKFQSWIFEQIDKYYMDESNPKLTFEIAGAGDTLRPIFRPLDNMFDHLYNGCQRCLKQMETAYQTKVKNNKK